jgi:alkyldihydroxyacetonephosphate synthase
MDLNAFLDEVRKITPDIRILDREEDRLAYSHGAYPLEYKWILQGKYQYMPSAIVMPYSVDAVSQVVKLANQYGIGLIPFGGGSGIVGGTKADNNQVMIDTKLLRNFSINHRNCTVTVGAGWTGAELENKLNHFGYTSGHYPQSFQSAVIGGMVATRAIGTFSTKYGKMDDIVTSLEVVLPDGDILQTHRAPKRSTGPELMELFLGSEGVYGIVTEVEMKIYPKPEKRIFEAFTFPSTSDGLEAIRNILRKGVNPAVVRLYDEVEAVHRIELMGVEKGQSLLYLGYEGFVEMVALEQKISNQICLAHGATYHGLEAGEQWFKTRFSTKKMQDYDAMRGGTADAIEVAAPWDCIENVWRAMREALEPMTEVVDCHFSHVYHSGASVYVIFHAKTGMDDVEGAKRYRQCLETAVKTSIANGGNVSHHHGVGTAKADFLVDEHGEAGMKVMKQIKQALDPKGLMNKGVLGL